MREKQWEVWVYEPGIGAWPVAEHREATEARDDTAERNAAAQESGSSRWYTWRLHNEVDCDCDQVGGDVSRAVRREWEAAHPAEVRCLNCGEPLKRHGDVTGLCLNPRPGTEGTLTRFKAALVAAMAVALLGCAGGGIGERCDNNGDCDPGLACVERTCTVPLVTTDATPATDSAPLDAAEASFPATDSGTDAVPATDATPPWACTYCAGTDGAGNVWCESTCTGAWPCCADWCSPACMICEGGVC